MCTKRIDRIDYFVAIGKIKGYLRCVRMVGTSPWSRESKIALGNYGITLRYLNRTCN